MQRRLRQELSFFTGRVLAIFFETWYTKLMPSVQVAECRKIVGKPWDGERFECMDCKRAQELITAFINEQLKDDAERKAFLEHIDECAECREELEVTYSLITAMKQLDEDTDLSDNYIAELNRKIETCYIDGLRKKRSAARRKAVIAVLIAFLLLMNGITVVEEREELDRRFLREVVGVDLPGTGEVPGEESGVMAAEYPDEDTVGTENEAKE